MIMRLVAAEDLETCGLIYAKAFAGPPYEELWSPDAAAEMLAGVLERDPESCWCAEDEGRVIGFAFCTSFGTLRATIQEFAVDPEYQGRGAGTALMRHLLSAFEERGIRATELVVNRDAPALQFYQRFGFRPPYKYMLMVRTVSPDQ